MKLMYLKLATSLALGTLLSACGGSDNDDSSPSTPAPAPVNQAPSVSIDAVGDVSEGSNVTVTASATDSDGTITSYLWEQISGPTLSFDSSSASISFAAPEVDTDTNVELSVTVTDNDGATASQTTEFTITNSNDAPVISFAEVADVTSGQTVVISATATDENGIESYQWAQQSGPEVDFTANDNSIEFIAPEVQSETNLSFSLTVTDTLGLSAQESVSVLVAPGNRAPAADDIDLDVQFNEATLFTLSATDPDGDELSFMLPSDTGDATIAVIDEQANQYQYTPATNSIAGEQYTLNVSDGTLSSNFLLNVTIVDSSSPEVTNISPATGSTGVALNSPISAVFSDVMNTASLTYNETNGACVGSFQVSNDDFTTCIAPTDVTLSGYEADISQYFHTVTFNADLEGSSSYQVRTTAALTNFDGTAAQAQVITEFDTANGALLISEVSSVRFSNGYPWFEIYNGTGATIDLSDYKFRTRARDFDDGSIVNSAVFTFPQNLLPSGEYAMVQGMFGDNFLVEGASNNPNVVMIGVETDSLRPQWLLSGFIELLSADELTTIDFVRFGSNTEEPMQSEQWQGANAPGIDTFELGHSLKRSLNLADTNSGNDWQYSLFSTPGGQNDVTCESDADEDGIPDCAEVAGSTYAGLPLYEWGARQGVKDIFIEVDYMDADNDGIIPQREAMQKMVDSFAAQNIAVHMDAGDLYDPTQGTNPSNFDLGGGNAVPFAQYSPYNFFLGYANLQSYKIAHSDLRRRLIFHYLLMANSYDNEDGSAGSSGVAELNGNDFIVSLGAWNLDTSTDRGKNATINFQAATMMHELGHNLGLRHGGDEQTNYKPNHISIMNYLYQLEGLPTIGNQEGDRYFKEVEDTYPECSAFKTPLINGPYDDYRNFMMTFSSGVGGALDESAVAEPLGLRNPGSQAVDFSCNLDDTETVSRDLNEDGAIGVLNDVNEWTLIELRFYLASQGQRSGASLNEHSSYWEPQGQSDMQQTALETPPSDAFFQNLRAKLGTK